MSQVHSNGSSNGSKNGSANGSKNGTSNGSASAVMPFEVSGYALVVGAAGGIGREIGFSFAEAGAKGVLFADLNYEGAAAAAEASKAVASSPEYQPLPVKVNVTNRESVQAMVDYAAKEFGRIDYCINAVGIDGRENVPMDEADIGDFERVMDINTKSIFIVTGAVAKYMKNQEPLKVNIKRHGTRDLGRGAIVNISSALGVCAVPNKVAYVTSKHAITGITRATVMDYKQYNIRCNQVCPTWVRTPMSEEEYKRVPQLRAAIERLPAAGRLIEPDEIASACLYLCTPSAAYLNGHILTLDSGILSGPTL
ncbi:NAD(P)-binding protein [Hypomontagnella submonticulosa]|nr:NAD(P)-binding protein [Hypomontagnella submonticulosa]